ncbi:ankyrin repeat domain-containing protein [Streptomyces sp. A3M-1-3]|uniref:ankyrin repeat domain-containing protein n=1 Tax=Streptomyces sp. A3M-1-3 TaxID=2962044 RepID=UPI0020B6D292|nr:ankyrin repeat domain-containing protein [Streptomyces sp. A3M-1-3]MCP3817271.1 ankyrin repeat domain-containing protein [Streptomyces sp. A3M-1-3]
MDTESAAGHGDLFEAVVSGEDDTVVRLLRAGIPAEATDEEGQTALYLAAVQDQPGIARLLLAAGADPDRPSGADSVDLPLCGAACGGHAEVVRALLAAGAQPDRREEFGYTAMTWAVQQGHSDTVEALLAHGASPDLAGPRGEPPLLLAARRGAAGTVRALLEHGAAAKNEALGEARRWLAMDVGQELRRRLTSAYEGEFEAVTRRVEEDGGVTVIVELVGDGAPRAGDEQQTGHAAIATLLEAELGIQTPFAELAERALRCGDPANDDWIESMYALHRRGDEETFQAASAWCASGEPMRQAFAADVLGQLGFRGGEKPFAARSLPVLRELAREAADPELIQSAVLALGHQGDPAALPEVLRHAGHPDREVRHRVALALGGMVPGDHEEAIGVLVTLSGDPDDRVRDWATMALAGVEADTAVIREALAARLDDDDTDTVAEAARGLALRQDPRAAEALIRLLADGDPDGYAYSTAVQAVEYVEDDDVRMLLERTAPRCR